MPLKYNVMIDIFENFKEKKYLSQCKVMAAALFYQYLSEKDGKFLKSNNYTKEEVLSGFKQLLMQSGYNERKRVNMLA